MKPYSNQTLLSERIYWRERFLNFADAAHLPLDFKRPLNWSGKYDSKRFVMENKIAERLNHISNKNPLSLLILISSAWSVLLHIYTGETDIGIATVSYTSPNEPEIFDSAVCSRISIQPSQSFKELLLKTRREILEDFRNQALSYEEMLTELGLKKKKNRSLLFSTLLRVAAIQKEPSKDRYRSDIFLAVEPIEQEIAFKFEFNRDLFLTETIEVLFSHFQQILAVISENTEIPICQISCLTLEESHFFQKKQEQLIHSDNQYYPCLHHVFEEMAAKYPKKTAVEEGDAALTYEELNWRANRIAHYLIHELKVVAGSFIGIAGSRSLDYCIALLGILKAGCAFVPIDASYPMKRIEWILEDSRLTIVLTTSSEVFIKLSSVKPKIAWFDVNTLTTEGGGNSGNNRNPDVAMTSRRPAYMIYTSGSTGNPKGAVLRHDGKINHIQAFHSVLLSGEHTNCLFSASISTDISVWQVLSPLLCGAKSVIVSSQLLFDYDQFLAYIEAKDIAIMQFVPSFIQNLLSNLASNQAHIPKLLKLRTLILSGEEVTSKLINDWFKRFSHVSIINAYGPTEASDIVSYEEYKLPIAFCTNYSSIGMPLPNLELFILNKQQQIQPYCVPGEIYIGGVAVGEGYWGKEALTEHFFVNIPFNSNHPKKWYRTGDYARMRPGGKIEFLGRLDQQVKMRGYRIEPGEVENCILNLEYVKEVKVIKQYIDSNEHLSAYIILKESFAKDYESKLKIKTHMSHYLPDFMIPQRIHFLEHFPMLPNGKLDVVNLPLDDLMNQSQEIIAPKDEFEKNLAEILAATLGVVYERVGMQSNLFDLGCSSLHLMTLKYRIKEKLRQDIPIDHLFRFTTLEDISNYIKSNNDHSIIAAARRE